jgi:hypothetical protein
MKTRLIWYPALLLILLALILVACGGGDSVSFGDIPVYEGAVAIEPGQNDFADLVANLMSDASSTEDATSDVELYTAPEGTTWDDIKAYYDGELSDTDWESDTSLSQSNEAVSIAGWTRGSGGSEQALLIGHTADPLSSNAFIIVVLLTE